MMESFTILSSVKNPFSRQVKDGATWTLRKDFQPLLPDNLFQKLHDHQMYPELKLLKENNVRAVFLLQLPEHQRSRIFVKRYKCRGLQDACKYLFFPSKALSEWQSLKILQAKGLPAPRPLAFAERRSCMILQDSCILMESLAPALSLHDYFTSQLATLPHKTLGPKRELLARALGHLIKDLHQKGVFYRDLHAGNILIKCKDKEHYDLFLVDVHRAFFPGKMMWWMRARDLAQLCNSLPWSTEDRRSFLNEYCKDETISQDAFHKLQLRVMHLAEKLEQRRLKSRGKRCLKNSTVFEAVTGWQENYYGRRDFGRRACLFAVEHHKTSSGGEEPRILKRSSKSILTIHQQEQGMPASVCVKGYRFLGVLYAVKNLCRKSRAMKSWIAGNALIVRGINTPVPLALLERKFGPFVLESFLITEGLAGAAELNDYVGRLHQGQDCLIATNRKRNFIKALAKAIRNLHTMGVYHADLKSNNILVREEENQGWTFYFVDLDRVKFNRLLSFHKIANNLAQINASVSGLMSIRDRMQFFHFYAQGTSLFSQRRKFYREILTISRTKNTEPFGVSFIVKPNHKASKDTKGVFS